MAKVTYLINGKKVIIDVPIGLSLAQCGVDNGLEIEHPCGFNARCTKCFTKINKGVDFLSEKMEHEIEKLEMKGMHGNERLSCQCVVEKDGEIEIEFESWHHQQEDKKDEEGDTVFI
tara:strand:- start:127 stop:477 length:351 start_codon:yes stop_codon:yes gene_type:complete